MITKLARIKTTYTAWRIERQDGYGFIARRIHGPHKVIHERSLDRFEARLREAAPREHISGT
jgi:hypothetical protein